MTEFDALLRSWQREALSKYLEEMPSDFLAQVTPGGGKTIWGMYLAGRLLNMGKVNCLLVVAPTVIIKRQWQAVAAKEFGLKLTDLDAYEEDAVGIVATYAQVASCPEVFFELCSECPTLAIMDEVHHAGDKKTWGDCLTQAVTPAKRISLTGTPFRSDSHKISFVNYVNGVCVPDFVYSYAEAVRDGHCRLVSFPIFGGMASWQREGEAIKEAELGSKLPKKDQAALVKAALDPSGGFVEAMLSDAHQRLQSMPGAGGLVLADDQTHARELVKTLGRITGTKPVLAVSDIAGSVKRINEFKESQDTWIVTVRMVSEGVDIPRLRVVCYLTKYRTAMFFQQAVGRCVRGTGEAWFYVPNIPAVKVLAAECFDVRPHELKEANVLGVGREGYTERIPAAVDLMGSKGFLSGLFQPVSAPVSEVAKEKTRLAQQYRQQYLQQYLQQYRQTPEYEEKRKKCEQEYKEKRKARRQTPEYKEKAAAYGRARRQIPKHKEKAQAYERARKQTPEYKERSRALARARYAKKKAQV